MPLSQVGSPNIKALRNFSEHEVINGIFSSTTVPMPKGTVVTINTSSGNVNIAVTGTGTAYPSPFLSSSPSPYGFPPSYVTSDWFGIWNNQVRPCNSGDVPLGITLVDVAEYNRFGESYAARSRAEREEQQVVLSGEAVKILTRGWVKVNSIVGTPSGNMGAYPSGGFLVACPYNKTAYPSLLGKFLSPVDADGYALFKLEL